MRDWAYTIVNLSNSGTRGRSPRESAVILCNIHEAAADRDDLQLFDLNQIVQGA